MCTSRVKQNTLGYRFFVPSKFLAAMVDPNLGIEEREESIFIESCTVNLILGPQSSDYQVSCQVKSDRLNDENNWCEGLDAIQTLAPIDN